MRRFFAGEKKARRNGPFHGWTLLRGHLDVGCLGTFGALAGVVGHLVVLLQAFEARSLDCGEVNEQILAAVVRRDESEALGIVEPLDCTCTHDLYLKKREKWACARMRAIQEERNGDPSRPAQDAAARLRVQCLRTCTRLIQAGAARANRRVGPASRRRRAPGTPVRLR